MFEAFTKFAGDKVKSAIGDFFEHADLDNNGVADKVQIFALVDRCTALANNFSKSFDLPKFLQAINTILATVKALEAAIKKDELEQHLAEAKAIFAEILAFGKAIAVALKAGK